MAKNIADAVVALTLVQAAVTATVGGTVFAVRRAYPYAPPMNDAKPSTPCFINSWTLTREERAGGMRRQFYVVRMQLLIQDADMDRGFEAATRMHVDYVDRLGGNVVLRDAGGQPTVTRTDLRGGDPTLGVIDRGGVGYQGLDLYLDLLIDEAFTYA